MPIRRLHVDVLPARGLLAVHQGNWRRRRKYAITAALKGGFGGFAAGDSENDDPYFMA
jgi:hypothetical protein